MTIKAYRFLAAIERATHDSNGIFMSSLHATAHACVCGFRQLSENGKLTDVDDPDAKEPLLLLKIKPVKGTSFHILTDGDVYYPLSGKTHLIYAPGVVSTHGPMSEVDQILIKEAVRYWLSLFA